MNRIQQLIADVSIARNRYIEQIDTLSETQARWKPADDVWNIIEITEHLFWAEQGALFGMWKTLDAIREGSFSKTFDSIHKDLPIEKIIEITWQTKEQVPAVAAPRLGGSLGFWKSSLHSLQEVLTAFGHYLQEDELRMQAHPHPISGALDFQQRIEFLSFHINRHQLQVAGLVNSMPI